MKQEGYQGRMRAGRTGPMSSAERSAARQTSMVFCASKHVQRSSPGPWRKSRDQIVHLILKRMVVSRRLGHPAMDADARTAAAVRHDSSRIPLSGNGWRPAPSRRAARERLRSPAGKRRAVAHQLT